MFVVYRMQESSDTDAVVYKTGADYNCFLLSFDPAKPITKYQEYDTSQGGETQVERTQRQKRPAAPDPDQMTHYKPGNAQTEIQE